MSPWVLFAFGTSLLLLTYPFTMLEDWVVAHRERAAEKVGVTGGRVEGFTPRLACALKVLSIASALTGGATLVVFASKLW